MAEYRLKAAFLYNFVVYTEWPATLNGNLNLCVYGPDPFGEELDKLQGKEASGRAIAVHRINTVDGLDGCQMVFVARPVIGNLPRVLDNLAGRPVLTVADRPGAVRQGIMLNMSTDQGRITFEANLAAVRDSGLNLSAKLLRLATEVIR
ncbi:MAG: YfiR family protein [Thiobacillus sp.]|nr:YfiR family protein [Thiobacillus sp.]